MKKIAIKNQRENFLAKYEDHGVSAIPFIMAIEVDTLYSINEIKNIYQRTTGHEMNPTLHNKYFDGYPDNKILKDLYKINQNELSRLNIDVSSLVR
jgi:hypothetical protein